MNTDFENDSDKTPLELSAPFFSTSQNQNYVLKRSYSVRSAASNIPSKNHCFNALGICWFTCCTWPKKFAIGIFCFICLLFIIFEGCKVQLSEKVKTANRTEIKLPETSENKIWSGNFSGLYTAIDGGHYQKVSRDNLFNDLVRDLAFREDTLRIQISEEVEDQNSSTLITFYTVNVTSSVQWHNFEQYRFTSGQPFYYFGEENLQSVINIAEDQWWQMIIGATNVAVGRRFTDHQMTAIWSAEEAVYTRNYTRQLLMT